MTTWTIAISNETLSDYLDVAVIEDGTESYRGRPVMGDTVVLGPLDLPARKDDPLGWDEACKTAVSMLAPLGWGVAIGEPVIADNAYYWDAVPLEGNPLRDQWTPEDYGSDEEEA